MCIRDRFGLACKVSIPKGGKSSLSGVAWTAKFTLSVMSSPISAIQAWVDNPAFEDDSSVSSTSRFSLEKTLLIDSLFSIRAGYKDNWNFSLNPFAVLSWEINALFIKFAEFPPIKPIIWDLL